MLYLLRKNYKSSFRLQPLWQTAACWKKCVQIRVRTISIRMQHMDLKCKYAFVSRKLLAAIPHVTASWLHTVIGDYSVNKFIIQGNIMPKGSIKIIPVLIQIMARRQPGENPSSEPILVSLLRYTCICVTRSRWVEQFKLLYMTRQLSYPHILSQW